MQGYRGIDWYMLPTFGFSVNSCLIMSIVPFRLKGFHSGARGPLSSTFSSFSLEGRMGRGDSVWGLIFGIKNILNDQILLYMLIQHPTFMSFSCFKALPWPMMWLYNYLFCPKFSMYFFSIFPLIIKEIFVFPLIFLLIGLFANCVDSSNAFRVPRNSYISHKSTYTCQRQRIVVQK